MYLQGVKKNYVSPFGDRGWGGFPLTYIYHHSERDVAIKRESKMVYILILERCLYNGVKNSTNGEGLGGREREMEKEEIKGRENEKMKHKNIILNKLACMQL